MVLDVFKVWITKDEIEELYIQRMLPTLLDIVKKQTKHKPTVKEIAEAKEKLKEQFNILDIFEEIPALFKYYGQTFNGRKIGECRFGYNKIYCGNV